MTDPTPSPGAPGAAVVRVTRTLKATPAQVFDAWTDAQLLNKWLCPDPSVLSESSCDPVVGGSYRIVNIYDWGARVITGEYLVLEPPHRLVFTWTTDRWEPGAEPSQVTVTLEPDGDATEMTILHERLPAAGYFLDHAPLAWANVAEKLDCLLRTS